MAFEQSLKNFLMKVTSPEYFWTLEQMHQFFQNVSPGGRCSYKLQSHSALWCPRSTNPCWGNKAGGNSTANQVRQIDFVEGTCCNLFLKISQPILCFRHLLEQWFGIDGVVWQTHSLLLTAKGLECIRPSISSPLIRMDITLKVCISVWEADMKILVTAPTADEYLLTMLCIYAELCFAKFDASHLRKMPQGPLRPFKSLLLALAHTLGSSP